MRKLIWITLVLIITGLLYISLKSPENPDYKRAHKKIAQASISSKDDPWARHNFQMRRLISPVTKKIPKGIREKELEFASKLPVKGEFFDPSLKKRYARLGKLDS